MACRTVLGESSDAACRSTERTNVKARHDVEIATAERNGAMHKFERLGQTKTTPRRCRSSTSRRSGRCAARAGPTSRALPTMSAQALSFASSTALRTWSRLKYSEALCGRTACGKGGCRATDAAREGFPGDRWHLTAHFWLASDSTSKQAAPRCPRVPKHHTGAARAAAHRRARSWCWAKP
jgi:hypothetical protein